MIRRRWVGVVAAALIASALVPIGAAGAVADPDSRQRAIDEEVERLSGQVDEAVADETEMLAELAVTRSVQAELAVRLNVLDSELAMARSSVRAAEVDLDHARDRVAAARDDLIEARAALEAAKGEIREQAVAAFVNYGDHRAAIDVMLEAEDLGQFHEIVTFVGVVADHQEAVIERHAALQIDTEDLEAEAEAAESQAGDIRDRLARETELVAEAQAAQAEAVAEVAAEAAIEERLVSEARSLQADHENRIAELRAESEAITALLRARSVAEEVADEAPTPAARGVLAWPVNNPVVTSRYGYRTHPIHGTRRLHAGIDLRGGYGAPVFASAPGTVVFSGWRGGYGNTVIVDHGGSMATLYAHQTSTRVTSGQQVDTGDVVGTVGSTGYSTGPHLHFEVRLDGVPVDPLNYL